MPTDTGKMIPPWAVGIGGLLLGSLLFWAAGKVSSTGDANEKALFKLEARVEVMTTKLATLEARMLENTTRIGEVATIQVARGDRVRALEVGTVNLGEKLDERTKQLSEKLDQIAHKQDTLENFLRAATGKWK